jgi:hypothetical protein
MRRPIVLPWLLASGCRGLLGIDDPTLASDAGRIDAGTDAPFDAAGCGTADWDLDGIPDGCDPCPQFSDASLDHDSDGDGIGDGCDPHPNKSGDTRALWTGFASAGDIAAWTLTTGSWQLIGGRLVQADTSATARIDVPGTWSNIYAMTEYEVLQTGASPQAGFCAYVGLSEFRCCDVDMPAQPELLAWTPAATVVSVWGGRLEVGERVALTNLAIDAGHTCTVSQGALAPLMVKQVRTSTPGSIVLHTRQLSVAYRYLFVVQTPP